jgi:hypothetical protein
LGTTAILLLCAALLLAPLTGTAAEPGTDSAQRFRFESVIALDDMKQFIEAHLPLGSTRATLRKTFVGDGSATLRTHPTQAGTEKYIYDINLCDRYIWRWNISADYDARERLLQAYVNGEPVFASGPQKKDADALARSGKARIFKSRRLRPQATLGEKELVFLLLDADGDPRTLDDQVLTGAGPSRADAAAMGMLHNYVNVEPWRSIFDVDEADHIFPYSGCHPFAHPHDRRARRGDVSLAPIARAGSHPAAARPPGLRPTA